MRKGQKHSKKTIKLLSKSHKGKLTWNAGTGEKKVYICEVCKKQFSDYACNKRKMCSRKCKIKYMSLVMKGHEVSEITRKKIGDKNKGQKRGKIKDTSKYGHPAWNKGLKGIILGEKNGNWKGGISKNVHSTKEPKYKEWRTKVFTRDDWKCKLKNKKCKGQLQAHHIKRWAEYPELRYEVNNGIALCQAHHPRKRAKEKRLENKFKNLVSVSKEQN